jgi:hypothetical protein
MHAKCHFLNSAAYPWLSLVCCLVCVYACMRVYMNMCGIMRCVYVCVCVYMDMHVLMKVCVYAYVCAWSCM